MKITQLAKTAILILSLTGLAACSSTGEEAQEPVVAETESGVDATTRRTQELEAEARARAAAAEERMVRNALSTTVFYFDFDVAEFRQADRDVLTYHAKDLAANPSKRIRLEGHADERGTREYNLALGERRANGLLNFLIVNGAARSQIEVVSYGEERPAERGQNDAAYQQNRRVEISGMEQSLFTKLASVLTDALSSRQGHNRLKSRLKSRQQHLIKGSIVGFLLFEYCPRPQKKRLRTTSHGHTPRFIRPTHQSHPHYRHGHFRLAFCLLCARLWSQGT